jgi:hypothetical protein
VERGGDGEEEIERNTVKEKPIKCSTRSRFFKIAR